MATRAIITFPDPRLYQPAKPRGMPSASRTQFGNDLVETMRANHGAGLAAIQVGEDLPVFVVRGVDAVKVGDEETSPATPDIVMWHPAWRPVGREKMPMAEGCLSFPGIVETVERYLEVETAWNDADGTEHVATFAGIQAQVIQHESEHLEGRLFIEHLSIHRRDRVRTAIKKRDRNTKRFQNLMKSGFITLPNGQKVRISLPGV